ncbi:response regulator transcription factor [Sulfurovum sp.]|uniref:response regulator transcription factor n=1 Tax=Sulfurovum sp. TaxID=1969726 RepID=UPI0025FEA480|nr:response regulator transcription factor [Sulfurovum sp.]
MYDSLKDKTALYIEDEVDVLQNISELLSHFFKTFYTASDGETGYQTFLEHEIDVLLVDIELPKMNGIELIKKIRETHKELPVVVISAYTNTDYLLESIELNLDKYIVKPLTSRKIHLLLETLNSDFLEDNVLELDRDVFIYTKESLLRANGIEHALTRKELKFLTVIARKGIVTYDEIIALWEEGMPTENAIRSFIKHLRKKLPDDLIKNRNTVGYYKERDRG